MADDVLVRKVFNYIFCGGGSSKLSLLLQSPSPLEKLQTEDEVKSWLRIQAVNDRRFVLVKNQNGEVNGVRIDLRKRICLQYTHTDTCKRAQGKCKFWHICRSYVEGNCDGNCGRSHDFHDDNNKEKTTELGLEKFPSGAVRNIVARSLPQVCVAYLKGECDSKKCAFLHVCSQTVRGNQCECLLSHQLIDVNNKSILKQFDLVPHQAMKVEFVQCNILVPKHQKVYMVEATECSSEGFSSAAGKRNATSGIDSPCLSRTSEDNNQLPKTPAGLISGASEVKGTQEFPKETTLPAASKQEETASLPEKKRRVRKRTARPKKTTKQEPTVVRKETSQPFLCSDEDMAKPVLHVDNANNLDNILEKSGGAAKFLNIQAEEKGNDSDSSSDDNLSVNTNDFKTKYSKEENVKLVTSERVTQELLNTSSQVASQRVNSISTHESKSSAQKEKKTKKKSLGTRELVNNAEPGTASLNNSQSIGERDDYIENLLFKCLCTEYRCSASFSALQKRQDLSLQELADIRAWFGARTDKFVITEDEDGSIRDVTAFCPKLRLCFDYVTLNECTKEMCPYFHLCKEFITGHCGSGGNCGKNHQFQNERDEEKLSKLNLDWLTNEQLRELMRSSAPQVCLDYNEGTCGNGFAYCSRLHICKRYVMKTCSDGDKCWLRHELTFQTCLLEKYLLARVKSEQVLKAILICEEEYEEEDEEDNEEEDDEEQEEQEEQEREEECKSAIETTSKPSSSSTPLGLSSEHASQIEAKLWIPEGTKENPYGSAPMQESCHPSTARDEDMRERTRRLSVSSSCSSTMEPNEASPSKKTVFECLCKEYNCSVSFAVISQRQDLFPQGCEDIASWFRRQKDGFLLSENEDGTIAEVSAFCRRARLCFGHTSKKKCSKENCQYLHVCKSYVAGYCRFGGRCTMNHDFQDEKCRKVLSKLKLNGLTDEQLLKVVQLSSPQVCQDYNKGQCLKGDKCSQIHICKNFIRKKCDNEDHCSLEHEAGFRTAHARILLDKYGINPKGATGSDAILRMLVVCDDAPARPKRSKRKTSSKGASKESEKPRLKNEHSGDGSRALFTLLREQPIPCTDNLWENQLDAKAEYSETAATTSSTPVVPSVEPSEGKVFEAVCKQYHCSVSLSVVANRKDLFPEGCKNIDSWFRKWKSSFLITESDRGVITQIDAFSARARLCLSYNNNGSCRKAICFCLHVCRDYVTENCSYGATCTRNHSFHNGRDIAFLSTIKLDQLTDEQLRKLVLSSTPQVCLDYNNGSCARGLSCTRIHTCKDFLRGSCSDDYYCDLDHESAMDTGHTLAVLERFHSIKDGSGQGRADHLRKIILVCDGPDMSSKETGHVHGDKPDAPICSDFLLGKCKKGRRCSGHHCSRPFNWQYKVPGPEEWKSFSEKDNDTLEKLFCDPVQDADVVQMEEGVKDLQICINGTGAATGPAYAYLEDDLIKLPGGLITKIRRMSTASFVVSPSDPLATKWTWYWEDENGYWREYGNDSLGRDLQQMIEEAFCNKRTSYRFATSDHDYILRLNSTHRFQQQNLIHHTARDVKRRPLMLISDEEIQQLKRYYGSSSTNLPTEKSQGKDSNLPSHWSAMSRDEQFTRVKLEASSQEYKTVETLFRNTMKERVTNISIERVQNPFMWEKYCRKKENMATVKTRGRQKTSANEKRLFHGTSPETVVAICKQNFDWRLHGKNATVYGEGSYFAVNASYSHSYAKRDVDSCQYMFLANVLVGSYTKGHRDLRRPPAINPSNPESDLYDSCVDDKYDPTIFVVFDTDQFYPAYVIKYSVVSHNAPAAAHNYGVRQPAQTSQPYTSVQSYLRSLGIPIYPGTPSYASGSRSSPSVQSSHATRSSYPRSVTQVSTPQYQTSRDSSSSAAPNVHRSSGFVSSYDYDQQATSSHQARQASPTSTDDSKPNCSVM